MSGASSSGATPGQGPTDRATTSLATTDWRRSTPFAARSCDARVEALRTHGMHGSATAARVGSEAFEVRADVTVSDACETTAQLLRALIASLEVLSLAPDVPPMVRDAVAGCAFVARQAAGALAVIGAEVFPCDAARDATRGA